MKIAHSCFVIILALTVSKFSLAGEVIIYPAKNQPAEQQEQDKFQCYSWAKENTGFDPVNGVTGSQANEASSRQSGGVLRGAAKGAAFGAVVGDSSEAAGKGAAAGAVAGGIRQNRANRNLQQADDTSDQQDSYYRDSYYRAYATCLEGRGYAVSY